MMDASSIGDTQNNCLDGHYATALANLAEIGHESCTHCIRSCKFECILPSNDLEKYPCDNGNSDATDNFQFKKSLTCGLSESQIIQRSLAYSSKGEFSPNRAYAHEGKRPLVIALVGLPARGKTYISKKLTRYLNWIGISTKVFHIGDYRRQQHSESKASHEFFDPNNDEAMKLREKCVAMALNDVKNYLCEQNGEIAVYDATNTTLKRRQVVIDFCAAANFDLFFVESYCDSDSIIEANIMDVKVNMPDYAQFCDKEAAAADFRLRIQHYHSEYQPIHISTDAATPFLQIINQGERFYVNRINGNVQSRVIYYLMNIKVIHNRKLYLIRHGESMLNLLGRIGGDADLSERGRQFAMKLAKWIDAQYAADGHKQQQQQMRVWTSHMRRTIQTAAFIQSPHRLEHWKALNEIDAGVCEGLTYEEIAAKFPTEFANRDKDKFNYRYPSGESYGDLVARLEPVIMEMERQQHVLVVCHQAVARCLLAYFLDKSHTELPYIRVPLHSVIQLNCGAYGCKAEYVDLDVPCVDTHRSRPMNTALDRSANEALQTIPSHY